MGMFLARRLLNYVVLIFLASSFAYLLAATTLDPRSNYEQLDPRPSQESIEARLDELNLNDSTPLAERYVTWVGGVATGDFGLTIQGRSVNEEIARKAGVTLRLIVVGTVIGCTVGVAIGAYAAVRQYRSFDRVSTGAAFLVLAIPTVVIAVSLQVSAVAINQAAGVQIFQYGGEYTAGLDAGFWGTLGDRLQHMVLPTLTLAIAQFAAFSRYQRNMMLDVLGADFVRTAMAKGLTRRAALLKHALRTALIPTVTYFTFTFGILLAGTTFTEKIYGWNGMGAWVVDSIFTNDVHAVAAVSCFMAVCVMAASFLSDLLYAWLDPRVRVS
ncbi:ABC transporter permease [Marinitenerispora sediminis]|uniref:Peptide ABC transporter permease n=1 Tax=Marinitenerispora sediminis TaxID=1931232 RepID=A0A368T776_9ACTN|nr:ABC transporter permease [Marinitenerispora sediminis]RCV57941.1 peptide ABC transporter permease [Marinitenerispora sediminis]RCV59691.1 peptide ABC transporter permease [Marinitenerispora sediminis]RCV62326.1 peptide ABC transporter permease [Marinitenerispora sediminis]